MRFTGVGTNKGVALSAQAAVWLDVKSQRGFGGRVGVTTLTGVCVSCSERSGFGDAKMSVTSSQLASTSASPSASVMWLFRIFTSFA